MSSSFSLLMGSAGFAFGRRVKSYLAGAQYTDPYWSNVTFLLTGDNLTDYSQYNRILTINSAYVNKTIKKFGTGSLAINDPAGVSIPNTIPYLLGNGDYTIEFWFKANTTTKPYATIFKIGSANGFGIACTRTGLYGSMTGNVITDTNVSGYTIYGYGSADLQAAYDSGQWHHICITKNISGLMVFIDGWIIGNPVVNVTNFSVTDIVIGAGLGSGFDGYIDDFRITAGVARHTSNFLIDTLPVPYVKPITSITPLLVGELATSFELSANSLLLMGA